MLQVSAQRQLFRLARPQGNRILLTKLISASNLTSHRLKLRPKRRSRAGRPTCLLANIPSTQVDGQRQRRSPGAISIALDLHAIALSTARAKLDTVELSC